MIASDDDDLPYHTSLDCVDLTGDDDQYVHSIDAGSTFFRADLIGSSCSCFLLFLVGIIILGDKRIRGHPNNIIAFICMSDSFTYFQYISRHLVCGFGFNDWMNWLFATTIQYPIYYVIEEKLRYSIYDREWSVMEEHYHQFGTFFNTL